jgi:hypothetical protein
MLDRVLFHTDAKVVRQASSSSVLWDPDLRQSFGRVRPDVLITSKDHLRRLPVDAKYKDYGASKLSSADW